MFYGGNQAQKWPDYSNQGSNRWDRARRTAKTLKAEQSQYDIDTYIECKQQVLFGLERFMSSIIYQVMSVMLDFLPHLSDHLFIPTCTNQVFLVVETVRKRDFSG